MGVTIGNKHHSIDGGYGMMFQIRKIIAEKYDAEFGSIYSNIIYVNSPSEKNSFESMVTTLLENERFKEDDYDIIDFLFMSDCGGKIKYKTCNKIYNLIKNVDDFSIGYYGTGQTFNDFKNILKECYSKRMNLVWY